MVHRYRVATALWAVLLVTVFAAPAGAQRGEPEGTPPEPDSPAVLAILETDPQTPAEYARSAKILADLRRPDLARRFLKKFIIAKPSQQQLTKMADEFGSAMFIDMAAREELLPEAKQVADALLAAVTRKLQNPKRIAALIKRLQDPSAEERSRALAGLKDAHAAAVGPMIEVLAAPGRAAEHRNVRAALVRMGDEVVNPLVGILERSEPALMAQAIRMLAAVEAKEAVIYLVGPFISHESDPAIRAAAAAALKRLVGTLPTRRQAIGILSKRAEEYLNQRRPIKRLVQGRVELWHWDSAERQCVSKSYPPDDAARALAARLARDAYALAPDEHPVRMLYLTTMLEQAVYETGLDRPLAAGEGSPLYQLAGFDVATIEDVLEYALAGGHVAAATAAARYLGEAGMAQQLLQQGPGPAPLVRAAGHPDRRLRLAALDAIVRLQPVRRFPGSSQVPQSLGFFAATGGSRRALVAGPSTEDSRRIAGMLAVLGFEVDTASTGRDVIRLATASPDYELALIDASIERPPVDFLLQQIRHDCRSGLLRVGLTARSGHLPRAEQVARRDPMALAFHRPHTAEALAWQVKQLTGLRRREFVAHAQRQRQAAQALDRLAELAGAPGGPYDLSRAEQSVLAALYVPALSTKATAVLANLGTAESQRALVELASRWTQPLAVRQAAVKAFRQNSEKHGILLTTAEISRQYERYNRSETLDRGTQRVLTLILDCIEAPTMPVKVAKPSPPDKKAAEAKGN